MIPVMETQEETRLLLLALLLFPHLVAAEAVTVQVVTRQHMVQVGQVAEELVAQV